MSLCLRVDPIWTIRGVWGSLQFRALFRKIRIPANQTSTIVGDITPGLKYWWTVHAERGTLHSLPRQALLNIGNVIIILLSSGDSGTIRVIEGTG